METKMNPTQTATSPIGSQPAPKRQPGSKVPEDAAAFAQSMLMVGPPSSVVTLTTKSGDPAAQDPTAKAMATAATAASAGGSSKSSSRLGPDYTGMQEVTRDMRSPLLAPSSEAQPWSKNWVFEGNNPDRNPNLKPLFDQSAVEAKLEARNQLLSELSNSVQRPELGAKNTEVGAKSALDAPQLQSPVGSESSNSNLAALAALAQQLQGLDGNVESVGTSQFSGESADGEEDESGQDAVQTPKTQYGQKLSGSEFLDTRNAVQQIGDRSPLRSVRKETPIRPKSGQVDDALQSGGLSAAGMTPLLMEPAQKAQPPIEVTGHVVQGSMTKNRLSHEALANVSSQVKFLSTQGGGEMKIRMKPDDLGEVKVHVTSRGNEVGIRITASSDEAKRIIEESAVHLKDSLKSQNIKLHTLDVGISTQLANRDNSNQNFNSDQQSSNAQAWTGAQQDHSGGSSQSNWSAYDGSDSGQQPTRLRTGSQAPLASVGSRAVGSSMSRSIGGSTSRLDVMA